MLLKRMPFLKYLNAYNILKKILRGPKLKSSKKMLQHAFILLRFINTYRYQMIQFHLEWCAITIWV